MNLELRRGEVWWGRFGPSEGGEIQKTRPAVVVSNNYANRAINRVQVVPVTSRGDKLYPAEAFITLSGERRKVMAHQLTTVAKERISTRIAFLSEVDMYSVDAAIKKQLGF